MAKTTYGSLQRTKVRIFFVEADLGPGDMQELTQALTSAMRPAVAIRGSLPKGAATANGNGGAEPDVNGAEEPFLDLEQTEDGAVTQTPSRSSGPRNYRKPNAIDIDLEAGDTPWEKFAKQKASEESAHRLKYLVVAAWLHDFGKVETVGADHVFTCYQAADWTFDVQDPTAMFRLLKKEGRGTLKRGTFSINHIGLAEVKKLSAE